MSHDQAWTGADDLVPPFPQEPAFGSPEAVEQAAVSLRTRVLDTAERDEVLDLLDRHRDAFEQREDALTAEVERLRAEVERLAKVAELEAGIDSAARRDNLNLSLQRDALADALQPLMALVEDRAVGASESWINGAQAALVAGRTALRKAGRLP